MDALTGLNSCHTMQICGVSATILSKRVVDQLVRLELDEHQTACVGHASKDDFRMHTIRLHACSVQVGVFQYQLQQIAARAPRGLLTTMEILRHRASFALLARLQLGMGLTVSHVPLERLRAAEQPHVPQRSPRVL